MILQNDYFLDVSMLLQTTKNPQQRQTILNTWSKILSRDLKDDTLENFILNGLVKKIPKS